MKDGNKRPVVYVMTYAYMAERARELGYALTLHGSLARDADMVAIPWTHEAVSAEELAAAMIEITGGHIIHDETADPYDYTRRCPEPKPHGRLAWSIYFGGGPYIDLSVMPRKQQTRKRMGKISAAAVMKRVLKAEAGVEQVNAAQGPELIAKWCHDVFYGGNTGDEIIELVRSIAFREDKRQAREARQRVKEAKQATTRGYNMDQFHERGKG